MPVASLPMYDMPEVAAAQDALWAGIVAHGRRHGIDDMPARLAHGRGLQDLWEDDDLYLSQCCGYDVRNGYADRFHIVATPCYAAPGCEGADYRSVVVVGADAEARHLADLRGAVCAINGPESHSGMNALRALVAPLSRDGRFFAKVRRSGRHIDSLAMVAEGKADVAAIDCVTHALLARHRPGAVAGTRILCFTDPAPGLPLVVPAERDSEFLARLRAALANAIDDPATRSAREALLLKEFVVLTDDDYARIDRFAASARASAYPRLR